MRSWVQIPAAPPQILEASKEENEENGDIDPLDSMPVSLWIFHAKSDRTTEHVANQLFNRYKTRCLANVQTRRTTHRHVTLRWTRNKQHKMEVQSKHCLKYHRFFPRRERRRHSVRRKRRRKPLRDKC